MVWQQHVQQPSNLTNWKWRPKNSDDLANKQRVTEMNQRKKKILSTPGLELQAS